LLDIDADLRSWTKMVPKSGKPFESVMQQIRSTTAPVLSEQYATLRHRIIGWYIHSQIGVQCGPASTLGGEVSTSALGPGLASLADDTEESVDYTCWLNDDASVVADP
jgi:hypothetical protein